MTPVRTRVLEAMCTALKTVSELKTVSRFEPVPTDLARVPTPACYIYDVAPESFQRNNRVMMVEMELNIAVFIGLTALDTEDRYVPFNDNADIIEARIHTALHTQISDPEGIIQDVEDMTSEREISNESWGVLSYTVKVKYRHKFGDGFSAGT